MTTITFFVPGLPAQQGNHSRNAYGATYETSKNHKPWRDSIIYAAREAIAPLAEGDAAVLLGPVAVELDFLYARPKSHYRTGKNAHLLRDAAPQQKTSAPDLDKLVRAALDALTMAGVFRDDAQVCSIRATKMYGGPAGLSASVWAVPS